jgi:hypothetical protein
LPGIAYVQGNYGTPQDPQTAVNVTFTAVQSAGDLNVVVVGWNDSTAQVSAVTDSSGNTYRLILGPTVQSGIASQSIYYARNVAPANAGANTVTVTFTGGAQFPDIRILEYAGADPINPVDVTAANSGNSAVSSSGPGTTTNATDLIVGANLVQTTTTGPSSGFTARLLTTPDGDIAEEQMVTAAGAYSATAPLSSSGPWIMQLVAFRTPLAAGSTVLTAPSGLTTTALSTSQINLNWMASAGSLGLANYVVQRCQGAGCTNFAQIATLTATNYNDSGLSSGATYNYRVLALDAAGDLSPYSNVASATTSFSLPLKTSANNRYLVDQDGTPFLIMGDSPQAMVGNLSSNDMATYMANRESRGFNALWVNLLCDNYTGCNSDGTTYDGIAPFTSGSDPSSYDLSTPNSVYFSRVDSMLTLALAHNIVFFLDPIETGGWLITLENNGTDNAYNYGVYIGNRYKHFTNIVWLHGNDFQSWSSSSTDNQLIKQVMAGIASVDSNHLQTSELNYDSSYSNQDSALGSLLALDSAYTYYETYDIVLQSYDSSPTIPAYLVESNYEYENNTGALPGPAGPYVLREQAYWTMLSGGVGQIYGNHYIWDFLSGWQSYLDSPGALEIQYVNQLFGSVAWWNLVPDAAHIVVTGGYGTYDGPNSNLTTATYCTTSWISDGSLALAYCPNASTLTVNLSEFSGPVTGQWYDPSNGIYTSIAEDPFPNSGTQNFTTPGKNHDGDPDWVLVLHK